MVVQAFLKKTPFRLNMAENGEIGLKKFIAGKYDLILMDMQMPVMDGRTATTKMRDWEKTNRKSPTPVVALTAEALTEDIESCLKAGCDGHLSKPITRDKLVETITRFAAVASNEQR